jgi:hypothetical protein
VRLGDYGGPTTGHSAMGSARHRMPVPGAGEDLSVSSLRLRLMPCLRVLASLGLLFAIAAVESAGRRWLLP